MTRRLALVTRRFWPLVGPVQRRVADLAVGFAARGHQPVIVTAAWQKSGPAAFCYEDVPVVRVPHFSARLLGRWRYARALRRWISAHVSEVDLVYVAASGQHFQRQAQQAGTLALAWAGPAASRWGCASKLELEAAAALRACAAKCPVVVSAESAAELIAAGAARDRMENIPDGVPIPPPRDSFRRRAARQALGALLQDPQLGDLTPVAVCLAEMNSAAGLTDLLQAWQLLRQRRPEARLWLIGEGPARRALSDRAGSLEMTGSVLLPGAMESIDELLLAADIAIAPSAVATHPRWMLEAMAAGLPTVASQSDCASPKPLVINNQHGLTFPAGDARALAEAIQRLFQRPSLAAALGSAARRRAEREFSLDRCLDAHLALFARLTRC